jgi:TonB family protein
VSRAKRRLQPNRFRLSAIVTALVVNAGFTAALLAASAISPVHEVLAQSLAFVPVLRPQETPPLPPPVQIEMRRPEIPPPTIVIATPQANAITVAVAQPERPALPQTAVGQEMTSPYIARVSAALAAVKRYPWTARQGRREGVVLLGLTLAPSGEVLAVWIERSAQAPALDTEAVEMVRRAAPFPPFPAQMHRECLNIIVPIAFSLSR